MTYSSESESCEAPDGEALVILPILSKEINNSKPFWEFKTFRKTYPCDVEGCQAKFSRPYRLAAHKATHSGERPFQCEHEDCGRSYTSSYHLRRHKLTAHSPKPTLRKFKCEWKGCSKEFTLAQNAKKHYRRTHCDQTRTCPICGEKFFSHMQLKRHSLSAHVLNEGYKCRQCEARFEDNYNYSRHMRGHKVHTCPEKGCLVTLKNWSLMRKHIKTHPHAFVCFYCNKGYRRKTFLKSHIKRHMKNNLKRKPYILKKYSCDICSADIFGKQSLRRHKRVVHEKAAADGGLVNEKQKTQEPAIGQPSRRAPRWDKGLPREAMAFVLSELPVSRPLATKLVLDSAQIDIPIESL